MRYKLRIIGFTIDGPDQIIGDNYVLFTRLSISSGSNKNNHNTIAYHWVSKAVA